MITCWFSFHRKELKLISNKSLRKIHKYSTTNEKFPTCKLIGPFRDSAPPRFPLSFCDLHTAEEKPVERRRYRV